MANLKRFGAALVLAGLACSLPARATEWPRSDYAADPAVKFGVLPNGMRYAIRANHTPAGGVSVRFNIDAGSLQEAPDQRGLAHYLEHMAFRGSANFPDGEIDKALQRVGSRFGADTNASTGHDQTIFTFDVPRSDDASVGTVLAVVRDIAGNLTLDAKAAATESGVVLSELKLRDVPDYRAFKSELEFELKDAHAIAEPDGDPAVIAKAPVERIRDFYHTFYRPERATLVVVGDFDAGKMEAQIRALFSDWKGVGRDGADPRMAVPLTRDFAVRLFAEANASSELSVVWPQKVDPRPIDRAHLKYLRITGVALSVVNRRLQEAAASPARPFIAAQVSRVEINRAVELSQLSISYEPGKWREALDAAERIRLAALQGGVTQAEVDRALTERHAAQRNASLAADTRPSGGLANQIVSAASSRDIVTSPAQSLAMSDEDLKGLTAATADKVLKEIFTGGGPLIFLSDPQAPEGGEAAVKTAFLALENAPPATAPQAAAELSWPYTDFGKPGQVVESSSAADLGVSFMRFANGVRLTLRPSKLRANEVLVSVKIGNGRLDLAKNNSKSWLAGSLTGGGLKALSATDMQRVLAGKSYRLGFGLGDDGLIFSGGTTPADLDTQLQVMAAYMREPGYRPDSFAQFRSASIERLRQSAAIPSSVFSLSVPAILRGGDKRWATPTADEMQAATVDDVRALLTPAFADGAIDVVITGDISVEAATRAVAATFGAFPARVQSRTGVSAANDSHFPAGATAPITLATSLPSDQRVVAIAWPTHGRFPNLAEDAALDLMSEIMQDRLFNQLRAAGTVYSAQVGGQSSKVFDYGYVQALAQLQPDKIAAFNQALAAIIADLKQGTVTDDELARAKTPALQSVERARQTNDYWLSVLDGAQQDPGRLELARKYEDDLQRVSRADIVAAAQKYLTDKNAVSLVVGTQ